MRKRSKALYPNDKWNIEVSKIEDTLDGLSKIISLLIRKLCDVCIVQPDKGGYIVFRKATDDEIGLISNRTEPIIGRIVQEWKHGNLIFDERL